MKNYQINSKIADFLTQNNYKCFLPQRDTPQGRHKLTAETNIKAIQDSDIIFIIGKNLGNDTSSETGFAKGLGKKTVLLLTDSELEIIKKSIMIFFLVDTVLHLSSYSELNPILDILDHHNLDRNNFVNN
ncbi:MAG: hypothetical protein F6K47_34535 [Symploca sp. SIO2E6]|nr:hypothetical protein [Symploca sp. SIO2E6]